MNLQLQQLIISFIYPPGSWAGRLPAMPAAAARSDLPALSRRPWKKNLQLQQFSIIFIYPPGSWAGLHPAEAEGADLPACWNKSQEDYEK